MLSAKREYDRYVMINKSLGFYNLKSSRRYLFYGLYYKTLQAKIFDEILFYHRPNSTQIDRHTSPTLIILKLSYSEKKRFVKNESFTNFWFMKSIN